MKFRLGSGARPPKLHEDCAIMDAFLERQQNCPGLQGASPYRPALRPQKCPMAFSRIEIPPPDINLAIGSGTHAQQTGRVMMPSRGMRSRAARLVLLVVGDVNSTRLATITAKKLELSGAAHVEGRPSLQRYEHARRDQPASATDGLADLLFSRSHRQRKSPPRRNSGREIISWENTMIVHSYGRGIALGRCRCLRAGDRRICRG